MSQAYPAAPRVIAGVLAASVALLGIVYEPLGFAQQGCHVSAGVLAASATLLTLFLLTLALAPAALQRGLTRLRSPADLHDGGHVVALVIMACTIFFVLGWGGAFTASATIESTIGSCALGPDQPITGDSILRDVTINLAVFTLPTILYVSFVYARGPIAALRLLGLKSETAARAILLGALVAIAFLGILLAIETAIEPRLPQDALNNEKALQIAKSVTWLGAIGLAIGSGVGEEVFFRGFLQPRLGWLPTAIVFALAHVSYASWSEVIVVFLLALTLGLLYKVTGNLWATIATHFTFNLIELLAANLLPSP